MAIVDGPFLETFSGRRVNGDCLLPTDVSVWDICHAMASISRYAGHAVEPYSEAEHAHQLGTMVRTRVGEGSLLRIVALLYEAPCVYLGPKLWTRRSDPCEDAVRLTILEAFGVPSAVTRTDRLSELLDQLRPYRVALQAAEHEQLFPFSQEDWHCDSTTPAPVTMRFAKPYLIEEVLMRELWLAVNNIGLSPMPSLSQIDKKRRAICPGRWD